MKHIEINIGKACNNKCRFCMSSMVYNNEKKLTKKELVFEEIKKYGNLGYKSIGFLGGDISIHPDIYEILYKAKTEGFEDINIVTNAMLFSDYKKATKLISSGATRINISIHSHISDIEDYLTQIPGGLKNKLKAIDNFNKLHNTGKLKSKLSINIVLNGMNYKSIVDTCLYFYKIKKIDDIRINFLWNRFFFSSSDKKDLSIKYSDISVVLKKLIYISIKYNIRITFDSIPACIFYKIDKINYKKIINKFSGEENDHINEVSNINNNVVFDWKKQKKNEFKTKFESCKKCIYNNGCDGVWNEYNKDYGDSEFVPII